MICPFCGSITSPKALTATSPRPYATDFHAGCANPGFHGALWAENLADRCAHSRANVAFCWSIDEAADRRTVAHLRIRTDIAAAQVQVEQNRRRDDRYLRRRRYRSRYLFRRDNASHRWRHPGQRPSRLPARQRVLFRPRLTGLSKSVSRVPGAPPRTSTPATAPLRHRRTVHPVRASSSCA